MTTYVLHIVLPVAALKNCIHVHVCMKIMYSRYGDYINVDMYASAFFVHYVKVCYLCNFT